MTRIGKTVHRNWFAVVLVSLTALHIGYRIVGAEKKRDLTMVSNAAIGDLFPSLRLEPLDDNGPIPDGESVCRIAVVFNPFCQHCHVAASREASRVSSTNLATTWISTISTQPAYDFRRGFAQSSALAYAADVISALKINATPAAFLIGVDDRIKYIWTYSGQEDHNELRSRC